MSSYSSPAGSGQYGHVPVLAREVIAALDPTPNESFIDATVGAGGHAELLLEKIGPRGRLLGLDADPMALAVVSSRLEPFGSRAVLRQGNFHSLSRLAQESGFLSVDGILLDLGLSSLLLQRSGRGFSFRVDEPLDMRLDPNQELTAADLVNELSVDDLAGILRELGEEPRARAVARAIVNARRSAGPIKSTADLVRIVSNVASKPERIHPATRTFQALRMATNDELDSLAIALRDAVDLLAAGGRLAVISFHSLEDRLVKQFFAGEKRGCVCSTEVPVCICGRQPRLRVLTKKPTLPSAAEIRANPRSRSAKLRVAERLP